MNEEELMDAIRDRLVAQTWTGSSNVVFPTNSVYITPNITEALKSALDTGVRTPLALIQPTGAESDPEFDEEPDLIRFSFTVLIAVIIPGGAIGEETLMGANQTGGATRSEGQGLLEIEPEFYNAVGKLNALESITIQVRQRGQEGGVFVPPSQYIAYRTYILEAWGVAV